MTAIDIKNTLTKILSKKAKGYTVKERVSEYAVVDGSVNLVKQKITTKHIPADINAIKALLTIGDIGQDDISQLTDQQLEVEKLRLINMLNAIQPSNKEIQDDTT